MAHGNAGYPSVLAGRYRLESVVGSGGMGVVWKATDTVLDRQVACKVASGLHVNPVAARRFDREARHIAALSHPHIVKVFDFGAEDGYSYMVMEYVDGPSLRQVLHQVGSLSSEVTSSIALSVLAGLAQAHDRGILHRDVKPENVLLDSSCGAKLADFGISKAIWGTTDLTSDGHFVGTSAYASPEQLAGHDLGPASDLYSVGCLLFECLTGSVPYPEFDFVHQGYRQRFADIPERSELGAAAPPELGYAITRALAKEPSERFESAHEMRASFEAFASDSDLSLLLSGYQLQPEDSRDSTDEDVLRRTPGQARVLGTPSHPSRPTWFSRRRSAIIIGIAVLTIGVVVWVATTMLQSGPVQHHATLVSGSFLQPDQSLSSANGRFALLMQADGNLVEYQNAGRVAIWTSGSSGNFGAYAIMQADGNLVVYPHGKSAPLAGQPTSALWQSSSYGHPGALLHVTDDGVLEVEASGTRRLLWTSTAQ